ncbi:hypothetical protein X801_01205 [Opisthorchis viverrini]|uniref:Ion transport domain-containing protein n=1 Tax=Opisthorchis viverrini TaxID=6198 RepID=A0A1S8X889_OPIVI|nr:hypothetical protein X801_01205 [Opisthorchis viverrini]
MSLGTLRSVCHYVVDIGPMFVIRRLVKSQKFYIAVVVLVLLNTLCVSIEFYGQPDWFTEFLCKSLLD